MNRKRKRKSKLKALRIRLVYILIILLVSVQIVNHTKARYRSEADSEATVDLAYYVLDTGSISQDLKVDSILPSSGVYDYDFYVANYYNGARAETALTYTIQIKTTTNLPLTYSVHRKNQNTELITSNTTSADSHGTIFRYMTVTGGSLGISSDQKDEYTLDIRFDSQYATAKYEGILEYIQITIDSQQTIN